MDSIYRLLKQLEWGEETHTCPVCGAVADKLGGGEHKPDCGLLALLNELQRCEAWQGTTRHDG